MRLVKFSCGCIGFEPGKDKQALVVKACDSDWTDNEFSFFRRSMADTSEFVDGESRPTVDGVKSFLPLGREEAEAVLERIGGLVADGYGLRAVRSVVAPSSSGSRRQPT